jgi:hypothetical protein
MDKLPKMDCKGRKLFFYCKSFWGNMFVGIYEKFVWTQTWAVRNILKEFKRSTNKNTQAINEPPHFS